MKDEEKSAERKSGAGVEEGRSGAGTWPSPGLHEAASNRAASRGGDGGGGGGGGGRSATAAAAASASASSSAAAAAAAGIRVLKVGLSPCSQSNTTMS